MMASESGVFEYRLFALTIGSEIQLPELVSAEVGGEIDVTIRCGTLGGSPTAPGLSAQGDALVLTIKDVARYCISRGQEILVERSPGAPERNVRLFLLGSAFGALLHQRGLLPLHANAVEIEGGAVAFMGESGSGKSTLAAWFHEAGFPVIADDVCAVAFTSTGQPYAPPGLRRLRLWAEIIALTGRDVSHYPRSYVGETNLDKYDVALGPNGSAEARLPMSAIYVLERGSEFAVEQLFGVDAVEAIFANTYRGAYVPTAKAQTTHWHSAVQLARAVPVFRVSRRWGLETLEEQSSLLVAHATSVIAAKPSTAS